ncbi:MAG: nucleoside-diphosphate-sugar epimerase [Salibacteraceae bacterium]|jgi:nucleoside-diphosphate-sugar epimerase
MTGNILVIGALGQVGSELVENLRAKYGKNSVIASDIKDEGHGGLYEKLDILDKDALLAIVYKYEIKNVFNLVALLSATAEKHVDYAWQLSMDGHFNVLNLAKDKIIDKIFWPSSIAVFGPNTPKQNTPQNTVMDPNTVYGIAKQAGERWNEYYFNRYGVDVRSIRYPGLIGWKSLPGGGTTDYAVDIFHQARKTNTYECFLNANATLPMMMMEDAVRATIDIMEAPSEKIKVRSSYNLAADSFSPAELATEIAAHKEGFTITYKTDERDAIAASWPQSIDDSTARADWGWKHTYGTKTLVTEMLAHI